MSAPRTACLALVVTVLASACASAPPAAPAPASDATAGAAVQVDVASIERPDGETPAWWFRDGAAQAAARGAMAGRARNVILFVGDGMSLTTVTAARILDGQERGGAGEENALAWEHYPATALAKTYNTDAQTPDSAGTMTAMATGVKTRSGMINVGQQAARGDCAAGRQSELLSLWELAGAAGMTTGVVSTARVTHATPAATFARAADRGWESDTGLSAAARAAGCIDIARQLIEPAAGRGPEVLLGGGRSNFMTVEQADPEYPDQTGRRRDDRDLVAQWRQANPDGAYVWNADQLAAAPADAPLLGLFEPSHMQYEHDRPRDPGGEPSLAEMTRAAIQRLQRDDDGYLLLVEAGRIDHAHHGGNAYRSLDDTIAMSEAVAVANDLTSADDTLIVVTADHSHTLGFAGYPQRGNPILGTVREIPGPSGEGALATDANGLPYTTLSYSNGPGHVAATAEQPRPDLREVDTRDPNYLQEALVPMSGETHGGDDVGIWARGPGSDAVRGTVEQNVVYHFMLQATPRLREALCARDLCDGKGVPVALPQPQD